MCFEFDKCELIWLVIFVFFRLEVILNRLHQKWKKYMYVNQNLTFCRHFHKKRLHRFQFLIVLFVRAVFFYISQISTKLFLTFLKPWKILNWFILFLKGMIWGPFSLVFDKVWMRRFSDFLPILLKFYKNFH